MESRRVGTGRKGRLDATVEDDGGDGLSGYGSIHGSPLHLSPDEGWGGEVQRRR